MNRQACQSGLQHVALIAEASLTRKKSGPQFRSTHAYPGVAPRATRRAGPAPTRGVGVVEPVPSLDRQRDDNQAAISPAEVWIPAAESSSSVSFPSASADTDGIPYQGSGVFRT